MKNPNWIKQTYEMVELSPELFKNIRKIQNVEDRVVREIFSLKNLQRLDIRMSTGKGGSFFIEPMDGGRLMIKSITKPEYEIIKDWLPEYYSYILMNPNTYLSPILGVYKLKLQESDAVPPISFILMRNVLDLDRNLLDDDDMVLCFDMKGSL